MILSCHSDENRQLGFSPGSWGALGDGSRFGPRAEIPLSPFQPVYSVLARQGVLGEPL